MSDRLSWPDEGRGHEGGRGDGRQEDVVTPPPGYRSASWPALGAADAPVEDTDLLRARVEQSLGAMYEIIGEVGRGGMAVVYHAVERSGGRAVALKVLRSDQMRDPDTVSRFEREAMLTLRLRHEGIVQTFTVHSLAPRGMALALEFMAGGTLKDRLERSGRLSADDTRRLLADVALALAHAHELGIVHRDLKPDNIFFELAGSRAKIGDFGIAHAGPTDNLTLDGTAIGTPAYMSPEQIDGRGIDARSDVYGLGLVAWEMLTGQSPWKGETLFRMIERQRKDRLPPIETFRQDVPRDLIAVIDRCLEKSPERRWQDMRQLIAALGTDVSSAAAAPPEPEPPPPPRAAPVPRPGETIRYDARHATAAAPSAQSVPSVPSDTSDASDATVEPEPSNERPVQPRTPTPAPVQPSAGAATAPARRSRTVMMLVGGAVAVAAVAIAMVNTGSSRPPGAGEAPALSRDSVPQAVSQRPLVAPPVPDTTAARDAVPSGDLPLVATERARVEPPPVEKPSPTFDQTPAPVVAKEPAPDAATIRRVEANVEELMAEGKYLDAALAAQRALPRDRYRELRTRIASACFAEDSLVARNPTCVRIP